MTEGINLSHVYQHFGISVALWILVIFAVIIDLIDGVQTAKVIGQRVHSHKLRVTIRKIGEYWRCIFMVFLADTIGILFPFWAWPYLSILVCLAIITIEFKSVCEHAKKRKSHVAEIPKMVKDIVECATEHDAVDILTRIKGEIDDGNAKFTQKDN